jgi:hypothetical protein
LEKLIDKSSFDILDLDIQKTHKLENLMNVKDKTNKNEKIIEIRGIDNGFCTIILRKMMEKMDAEILQRAIDIKRLKSRKT